jgi:predicted RND superfamily exporter protein
MGLGAFSTTDLWMRMMTEVAMVQGIKFNLISTSLITLGSFLLFIGNWAITIIGCLSMVYNIAAMFAVFWFIGWDLGVVEAVGMSLMVGLACDYVFHMAESYVVRFIYFSCLLLTKP